MMEYPYQSKFLKNYKKLGIILIIFDLFHSLENVSPYQREREREREKTYQETPLFSLSERERDVILSVKKKDIRILEGARVYS
jgi:hypothetical protein